MKVLHTSDWHIGRSLYGKKRYSEFLSFLNWLIKIIEQEEIEILLVAGDIFDTSTPSNRSQALYYQFLCQAAASCCRHIVIIAGNHDSPTFLNAPKALLRSLNVHVVASVSESLEEEVIVLENSEYNDPETIICAVPYLRDRDIRLVEAGESIEDKESKLIEGIKKHYHEVFEIALKKQSSMDKKIPIIAMGHLFTAGGKTQDGDGVRELYVGNIAHVTSEIFPETIDYLALGHLHVAQKINRSDIRRYSGSPIAMGFGEAKQVKSICCINFKAHKQAEVSLITIPVFQTLEQIKGSWDNISKRLVELKALQKAIWIEVIYEDEEIIPDLRDRIDDIISESNIEVLRIKNNRIINSIMKDFDDNKTLDDLDINEVFERCLSAKNIPDDQQKELKETYQETIKLMNDEDSQAE